MKKILIFVSIFALTITLSACDALGTKDPSDIVCEVGETLNTEGECIADVVTEDPVTCVEGESLVDGACVIDEVEDVTCPEGQHTDDGTTCVVDPLVCTDGYHEEDEACVPNEGTELYRSMAIDTLITQMDNSPVFLGTIMQNMTFDQGMEIKFEIDLEVTKDVDVVETLNVVIIDTMVGNMVQREVSMDLDGEMIDFAIYYETNDNGGVNLYIQPGMFLEALRTTDPDAAEKLEWVGFDKEWAVFEFDETLDTMIQMDVLRDMLSTMFFNEMGVAYFYEIQTELEEELQLDLSLYGIDLGLLIDNVLAEEYDAAQLAIESIDTEGLTLHIDLLYVAPAIFSYLEDYETELKAEGFAYDTLAPLLDTSHWNYDDPSEDVLVLDVPLDGATGTEAFLTALTETDKTALVEVFKGMVEEEAFYNFTYEMELGYWAKNDFAAIFINHEFDFVELFGQTRYTEVRALFGDYTYSEYDIFAAWNALTPEEVEWIKNSTMYGDYSMINAYYEVSDYMYLATDTVDFLTTHKVVLDAAGVPTQVWIDAINTNGLEMWVDGLEAADFAPLFDTYLYTFIDDLEAAYAADNGIDFVFETIFSNPHTALLLAELQGNPLFDTDAMIANMVAIDWNLIGSEDLSLEELGMAIQEGPESFAAFLVANATTAPNMVLYLEIFEPAVTSVQPYMMYVDDMQYALEGLSAFDDLLDPMFYTDYILDLEMTNTDDITLLVEMEIDGLGYATLFDAFAEDLNSYLSGFTTMELPYDEDWVCIDDSEFSECEDVDVTFVKQILLGLDSSYITLELDPSNLTWTNIDLDFTPLLNGLVEAGYEEEVAMMLENDATWTIENGYDYATGVNVATVSVSMREVSSLDTPAVADTANVNDIASDFGKFLVASEGYSMLQNIFDIYIVEDDYSALVALFNTPTYLSDIEGLYINGAFDSEISFFVVTGNPMSPSTLQVELELFWIDGTEVFTEGLGLNDLLPLFLEDDMISEAAYDILVSYADEDTFSLTRVWLLLAMGENQETKLAGPLY